MATLLSALAHAGSRKSDGTPNASGKVYLYQAGTLTQELGYADSDATAPLATTGGAIALDAAGKATIFTKAPCDIVVADAAGAPIDVIAGANRWRAELVEVEHAGFTGALTDPGTGAVSQALGGITDFQTLLTRARASLGPDFQYQESPGATPRNHLDWMREVWISVKDMGAAGDGLQVDTVAIQKAINRAAALGGRIVYFPPGTYIVDQPLTLSATSGVSFAGAGAGATILKNASSTTNVFTLANCTGFTVRDMYITTSSGTSTGTALSIDGCQRVQILGMRIASHRICVGAATGSQAPQSIVIGNECHFVTIDADAAARAVSFSDAGQTAITNSYLYGGTTGACVEYLLGSGNASITGTVIDTAPIKFNANLTGSGFSVVGSRSTIAIAFVFGGATMPKGFYQAGNMVDGYKEGLLSGAAYTPNLAKGNNFVVDATTTGGAYTINVPTPPPAATDYGVFFDITFYAHAGAPITGWGLVAGYHVSAVPSAVDTHRTAYRFWWDPDASVWRERSRADTT